MSTWEANSGGRPCWLLTWLLLFLFFCKRGCGAYRTDKDSAHRSQVQVQSTGTGLQLERRVRVRVSVSTAVLCLCVLFCVLSFCFCPYLTFCVSHTCCRVFLNTHLGTD